jgi:hypothetical protein
MIAFSAIAGNARSGQRGWVPITGTCDFEIRDFTAAMAVPNFGECEKIPRAGAVC